jgi:hypothetical protein
MASGLFANKNQLPKRKAGSLLISDSRRPKLCSPMIAMVFTCAFTAMVL